MRDLVLYRGTVVGQPGSWVRLAGRDGSFTGAVWDGAELYAIERYDRVVPLLVSPNKAAAGETIIYRWSDTVGTARDLLVSGLSGGVGASAEISGGFAALSALAGSGKQLDIGLVGDAEFAQREGVSAEQTLINYANIADGIFVEQVGVHLNVVAVHVYDTEPDPFTTADPDALLAEVSDYKLSTPELAALGIVHLVTGRDLIEPGGTASGTRILGIAHLGVLCDPRLAVSLTQEVDFMTTALVMTHEIGHNFGAPHDAEAGSACASTPTGFLMSPTVNGSQEFSQCSLQQMQPEIAAATCLTPMPPNDLSVVPGLLPDQQALVGRQVTGSVGINNTGPSDAYGVEIVFEASGIDLTAASACTLNPSGPSVCTIYRVPSGGTEYVDFYGMATQAGPGEVKVSMTSWNDPNPANDTYTFLIDVVAPVNFDTSSVVASPDIVHPGETSAITWDFINHGPAEGTNVMLLIDPGQDYQSLAFAPPNGGTCAPDVTVPGRWRCSIGTVPVNLAQRLTMQVQAASLNLGPGEVLMSGMRFEVVAAEPAFNEGAWYFAPLRIADKFADLAVEMTAPTSVLEGDPVKVTLVARNDGADAVGGVSLRFLDSLAMSFTDIVADGADCTVVADDELDCTRASMAAGESFRVVISGPAGTASGTYFDLNASIMGDAYDPFTPNGHAEGLLLITRPAPPPAQPPGGGGSGKHGGGAVDPWLLALLTMLAAWRRRATRRNACAADASAQRRPIEGARALSARESSEPVI